jgi:hypothetical protein
MKKILMSLVIITTMVAMTAGATRAVFTDSSEIQGVTFSTGNADLQMTQSYMGAWFAGNASAADLAINFPENIYPGYEGSWGDPDGVMYLGNFSTSPINSAPLLLI